MSLREEKARQIVNQHANIKRAGDLWLVPSQSGRGSYKVDPKPRLALAMISSIGSNLVSITTITDKRGKTTTTTTETVKVTRQTYRQEWPAYNKAQTQAKRLFQYLLHQICQGIGSPSQTGAGRRCLPLEDAIFAMAFKVYSTSVRSPLYDRLERRTRQRLPLTTAKL